jgi:hypothetical protein
MALLFGKAKSWAWWLAGLACALLFGPRAQGGPGVAGRPGALPAAAAGKEDTPAAKTEQLVEDYLKTPAPAEPAAAAAKEIAKLISLFGSDDFEVRDEASRAITKHGAAAIGALRQALKSKDAEVANRAEVALATIEALIRQAKADEIVALYKKWGGPVLDVVQRKYVELTQAARTAAAAALEAEKAGKAEEVAQARAQARSAREREAVMARLYRQIAPPPPPPPYGMLRQTVLATPRASRPPDAGSTT